ncbi:MAG: hypothetical protein AABZ61_03030 [Bacteroidota bacterium]
MSRRFTPSRQPFSQVIFNLREQISLSQRLLFLRLGEVAAVDAISKSKGTLRGRGRRKGRRKRICLVIVVAGRIQRDLELKVVH